jgi:biopolymer transport protein ExbD
MGFASKNKPDPSFNMSSMTDMIFLLLVFFMLTSNFATPSGLNISVPTSKASEKVMPKITIGITKDLKYYLNDVEIPYDFIEDELKISLRSGEKGTVVIAADKTVPVEYLIKAAGVATKLGAKVTVATKPQ